jgi:hypothetical protein
MGSLVVGGVFAFGYGIFSYFAADLVAALPTIAFLLLVPVAMGAVPLLLSDEDHIRNYVSLLLTPWLAVACVLAVLVAIGREGAICFLVLGAPLWLGTLLGTLTAFIIRAFKIRRAKRKAAAAALLLLPFMVAPLEQRFLVHTEMVTVTSEVEVDAPPASIWSRIAAFDTIDQSEYQAGIFNLLGVPRPLRAEVDRVALGGLRTGYFEYGLVFDEVITELDSPRRMTFSISVDPKRLRRNSMERHALEGSYFRFIDASYTLEPIAGASSGDGGRTRVVLSSRYEAKSSVNAYGKFCSSIILSDFQDRLLDVLRRRAAQQK